MVYVNNSCKIHPKLHISEAWSYWRSTKHISGARYHLDPTWIDIQRFTYLLFSKVSLSYNSIIAFLSRPLFLETLIYLDTRSRRCIELNPAKFIQVSGMLLDIPKSHILALQFGVNRILADLKSRCITFVSWRKHNEHNIL